jgi:hypothetical protein
MTNNEQALAPTALHESIVELAETPDDASQVQALLQRIVKLVAAHVRPVAYTSVTAEREGAPTTVAMSNELALEVDQAQYDDCNGPCLDALNTGIPISVPDAATTLQWPGFRDAAASIGLQASLSIPLFAGRGYPVAALNLYARRWDALAPLTNAILAIISHDLDHAPATEDLDPGSAALVTGIYEGFHVQQRIQVGVGLLMARDKSSEETAYLTLREHAANSGTTLLEAADNAAQAQSRPGSPTGSASAET